MPFGDAEYPATPHSENSMRAVTPDDGMCVGVLSVGLECAVYQCRRGGCAGPIPDSDNRGVEVGGRSRHRIGVSAQIKGAHAVQDEEPGGLPVFPEAHGEGLVKGEDGEIVVTGSLVSYPISVRPEKPVEIVVARVLTSPKDIVGGKANRPGQGEQDRRTKTSWIAGGARDLGAPAGMLLEVRGSNGRFPGWIQDRSKVRIMKSGGGFHGRSLSDGGWT